MNNNDILSRQSLNNEDVFRLLLVRSDSLFKLLIFNYEQFNSPKMERIFNNYSKEDLHSISTNTKFLCQYLTTTLQDETLRTYLNYSVRGKKLFYILSDLITFLAINRSLINDSINDNTIYKYLGELGTRIFDTYQWIADFRDSIFEKVRYEGHIQNLQLKYSEALAHIDRTNLEKTEELYSNVSNKYVDRARIYEALFYMIFVGAFLFTIVHIAFIEYKGNEINYILTKVMTLTFVVTLGTLFLRKAAHLRKLNDQTHQTSLELRALPLFLKNVKEEDHSDIYKELASKYFGRDIDQSQNDKIGDLLQDQVKAGTELIKASAEMVKGVKTSFGSATTTEQTKSVKPSSTEE